MNTKNINNVILNIFEFKEEKQTLEVLPTGSLSLDLALGTGGIPKGSLVEIFGSEDSGKTTLLMHIISEAQKLNKIVVFVDTNHTFDIVYASSFKIRLHELFVVQPKDLKDLKNLVTNLADSNEIDLIIIDSITGVAFDETNQETLYNDQLKLLGEFLRKLFEITKRLGTTVIFTSHLHKTTKRLKRFCTTTTGGDALELYSTLRLKMKKIGLVKDLSLTIGNRIEIEIVKNKTKHYKNRIELDILFNSGIGYDREMLDLGISYDLIKKSGSWYYYNGEQLGQGLDNTKAYLRENPQICFEITSILKSKAADLGK